MFLSGTLNNNSDVDDYRNIEIKIPFADMGLSGMTPRQTIGISFWTNEEDTCITSAQYYYRWTPGAIRGDPSTWGIAQF